MVGEDPRSIDKPNVAAWIAALSREAEVLAPQALPAEEVGYAPVRDPAQVLWQFENPLASPKTYVLPQTDPIVRIERDATGRVSLSALRDVRPRVLFNLRSCDATAIGFLRRVHAYDLEDDTFLRRVEQIALVTLTCTAPAARCFCTCTQSGPFLEAGYDLQLTDLGARLLVEIGSARGRELIAAAADLFSPATAADRALHDELAARAWASFGQQTCHFASAMRRISTDRVPAALWEQLADWCLECGGCNMICPTCYCFSVKDLRQGSGWLRCRTWDSCQYPAFTLEASGHNPRQRRSARMQRRFFHKVSAQYYARDGILGCVGCGRCIEVCLGATDMPTVVAAIRAGAFVPGRRGPFVRRAQARRG